MDKFIAIIHRLNRILALASAFLVPVLVVLVTYDIVRRAFNLQIPKGWSVELGEVFMLLMAYLAASYILSIGAHVNVDVIIAKFSPRLRFIAESFDLFLFVLYGLVMIWRGGEVFFDYASSGKQTVMGVTLYPFVLVIPLAGLLLVIESVIQVYLRSRNKTSSAQPTL